MRRRREKEVKRRKGKGGVHNDIDVSEFGKSFSYFSISSTIGLGISNLLSGTMG